MKRHILVGMRVSSERENQNSLNTVLIIIQQLAKLHVTIITALYVSAFDFSLCDDTGRVRQDAPLPDRHKNAKHHVDVPIILKYSLRENIPGGSS